MKKVLKKQTQKKNISSVTPSDDSIYFLPLGGVGQIGMNACLYGHAKKWILVDLGASFANPLLPGANAILPDISFIIDRKKDLEALIVTHAHEDHIGAIPWLWQKLGCPIYATTFTACVLRRKWRLDGHGVMPKIHIIKAGKEFKVGAFDLQFITMTHSIPEPSALMIRCKGGKIFHSGDWKLDPNPVIGEPFDKKRLVALGKENIDALICDSTNVFDTGHSGSEGDLQKNFEALIAKEKKRVAVTMFASNISRLYTIAKAAYACGRTPVLVGSALVRMDNAAREAGYLDDLPLFPDFDEALEFPSHKTVLICTGSQSEPRSALFRMAYGTHPYFELQKGDCVLFSSRVIPGNEKPIEHLKTQLLRRGVTCISGKENGIHVSGHPGQEELKTLYQWLKPKTLIPIHGEWQHLQHQIDLAKDFGISNTLSAENGTLIEISEKNSHLIGTVSTGYVFVDGCVLVKEDDAVYSERRKMTWNGAVAITLFADEKGNMVQEPIFASFGIDAEDMLYKEAPHKIHKEWKFAQSRSYKNAELREQKMMDIAEKTVSRLCRQHFEKRPLMHVNLVRLD